MAIPNSDLLAKSAAVSKEKGGDFSISSTQNSNHNRNLRGPEKSKLVMEEKAILFQAVVPIGGSRLMNAWFKILPTLKISEPFHASQPPFRLGISSTFVGSDLYTIGGRVPNHFELSKCISCLRTVNIWDTSELPSPCADSVLAVYRDSLYILRGVRNYDYYNMEGYIWNTRDNKCLQTRICPPIVEGGERQWGRIRACAALNEGGLLIAMDGENTTNFYLHPEPEEHARDWEEFGGNPLPRFMGETSFAASNGRLYILEVGGKPPAFLFIYNIKEGKLVIDRQPIPALDHLWTMHENATDRVVRLVPVADDRLCFLWLGPVENDGRPPGKTLYYLKLKFSFNPNEAFDIVDDKSFPTNITELLDCLPCGPEQFTAEVDLLDASEKPRQGNACTEEIGTSDALHKQPEDDASAEPIGTSLISGEPFQDQAEDVASPKEKGKGKRRRTQLEDPLSSKEQKRAQRWEDPTFRYKVTGQNPLKDCFSGIYYRSAIGDDQELVCPCVIMNYNLEDNAISQIKLSHKMGDECALKVLYIDNRERSNVKVLYPWFDDTMSKWLKKLEVNNYQPPMGTEYDEWMKAELVIPKIKKLWKLLFEMMDKNMHICKEENDQGYIMPLINREPKLLHLQQLQDGDNIDMNYAKSILGNIVTWDEALDLPRKFHSALEFWNGELRKETDDPKLNCWLCSKHPIFYGHYEKKEFLLLVHHITFTSCYELKGWLDGEKKYLIGRTSLIKLTDQKIKMFIDKPFATKLDKVVGPHQKMEILH